MCTQPDIKKGTNGCKMKKIENLNKCANDPRMMTVSVRCTSQLTKKSAQIKMLPDTGSEVTAADKTLVKELGLSLNQLQPSDITPTTADARDVIVLGKMIVTLELNGKKSDEEIYIFKSCSGPKLSQMACKRLGIVHPEFPLPPGSSKKVDKVEQCKTAIQPAKLASQENMDEPLTKEGLIAEFPRVFDGIIRSMPGEKYQIKLTEEVKPFCVKTPRVVPLPLKDKLKEELDLLEKQGIITSQTKVTDWCAPIVVAPKKNSEKIRLCVDFNRLHKFVKRERYLSNTPAQAVLDLHGAQVFSVFDAI